MCTLFANLYVLLTWGPHMVYMGTPYIFDIYMIRCGWLGEYYYRLFSIHLEQEAANQGYSPYPETETSGKHFKTEKFHKLFDVYNTTHKI